MFKQGVPAITELVWTGHRDHVEGVGSPTAFSVARLPALRQALDRAEFDLVVGHPPGGVALESGARGRPAPPLPRQRAPALIVRSLGIRLLLRPTRTPLVIVDLADSAVIRRHNLPLLDRACVYFKRELPADRSKAFAGAVARDLPSRQQLAPPRFAAWCSKLAPISLAVSPIRAAEIGLRDDGPAREGGRRVLCRPGRGIVPRPHGRIVRAAGARGGGDPCRPGDGATRPAGVLPPLRARVDRLVSGRTRVGLLSPLRGCALRERAAHESAVDPATRASSERRAGALLRCRDGRSRADRPGGSRGPGEAEPDGDRGTRPRPALPHAGTPLRACRSERSCRWTRDALAGPGARD